MNAHETPDETNAQVRLGDRVRIERRYVVDGALTAIQDEGSFEGVQLLGTSELLQLKVVGEAGHEVRLIPLPSISEITLLETNAMPEVLGHDPSVL